MGCQPLQLAPRYFLYANIPTLVSLPIPSQSTLPVRAQTQKRLPFPHRIHVSTAIALANRRVSLREGLAPGPKDIERSNRSKSVRELEHGRTAGLKLVVYGSCSEFYNLNASGYLVRK